MNKPRLDGRASLGGGHPTRKVTPALSEKRGECTGRPSQASVGASILLVLERLGRGRLNLLRRCPRGRDCDAHQRGFILRLEVAKHHDAPQVF